MAEGIIIIDKPQGWTSMDVCAKLRGMLKEKRIGHGGTLDPMATGVLPVFAGKATKAVEFAAEGKKEYMAGLRLGLVTNTQDTTGEVLEERPAAVSREQLEAVLERFRGEILQVPPMYSAIKKDGKKLYELARKGREVEREARRVTIYELELQDHWPTGDAAPCGGPAPADYLLRVRCSKGTYIRTLCHDIGQALGCGGCMSALRRTEAAGFTLADAVRLEEVQAAADRGEVDKLLLPADACFARDGWEKAVTLDGRAEQRLRNGAAVNWNAGDGPCRVYGGDGSFLALAVGRGGKLDVVKRFY